MERDDTPEAALKQIDDMQYTLPFSANSRKLFKIGVTFDSQKRILNGWKVQGHQTSCRQGNGEEIIYGNP